VSLLRKIPEELVDFFESGVSLLVGTRDDSLRPEMTRACGAHVSAQRTELTLFLPSQAAGRAIANLRANGRLAVGISRAFDANSFQLKGRAIDIHEATESERPTVERYLAAFVESLYLIGLPRALVNRFHVWPAYVVTFEVEDIFLQTPGPNAGKRLEQAK
jgi:hypothetical protein